MKKNLEKVIETNGCFYYDDKGNEILGTHSNIYGDVSGISGDVSDITGDVSDICGDVSNIAGDVSGIHGDVTNICGDIDKCEISEEERKTGICIKDLLKND